MHQGSDHMPGSTEILLSASMVSTQRLKLTVFAVSVRDVDTFAIVSSEPPTVEGTFEAAAFHGAADSQVGTHVCAVGIDDMTPAIFTAEHCKV